MSDNQSPFITVCMPVWNEAAFIEETLFMVLHQDYPADRYEIIVADGGSDDGTVQIINKLQAVHSQIILRHNPKKKSSSGRNIGFKEGRGDIFIIIDAHCYIPDNQLFKNIIKCFSKSGAACLGRPQPLDPPGISIFQESVARARKSKIGHGSDSMIYSGYEGYISPVSNGAIYKRAVIEKTGLVDEMFDACEDVDYNYRVEQAGFKSYMSPDLTIKYFPRKDIRALFYQMARYGKGRINLMAKHPDSITFKGLLPLFFILGLILNILSILIIPKIAVFLFLPYLMYLMAVCFTILMECKARDVNSFIRFFNIFLTIHTGLGFGQLIGSFQFIFKKIL